jgi:hypothetical protein
VTFRGNKKQAEVELTRLLAARDNGASVDPDKITVAAYLREWIATAETVSISLKTSERYRQLIENQILPHLGAVPLQKLKGAHIAAWHAALLREGGHGGRSLSARTCGPLPQIAAQGARRRDAA